MLYLDKLLAVNYSCRLFRQSAVGMVLGRYFAGLKAVAKVDTEPMVVPVGFRDQLGGSAVVCGVA